MKKISPVLDNYREIMEEGEFNLFVKDLIDSFLDDSPNQIAMLKESNISGDATTLERTAHTLKSSSMTFGVNQFTTLVAELEKKARQGDLRDAATLIERCEKEYSEVRKILWQMRDEL